MAEQSFENYKVYRVTIDSKAKAETLKSFQNKLPNLSVWGDEVIVNKKIDILVSPNDQETFLELANCNNLETSVLTENVGKFVKYVNAWKT